jgi:aspartate aminotransferase
MEMVNEFKRRKKRVMEWVDDIPHINCPEPHGAFYVFPEVKAYFGKSADGQKISSADELCMYLLHHAHVSTVTGTAFGDPECIRISFANNLKNIEEGFRRIKEALGKLS